MELTEEDRFPILLRGSWFGMNKAFRERIGSLGLTTSQYTILRNLSENPGISQDELSKLIGGNKNNASSLVKRMTSSGLVNRKPKKNDKRAFEIFLTSKGEKIFKETTLIADNLREEVLSGLPSNTEEELVHLLGKCSIND